MAQERPQGVCHICGAFGSLSFEHIPPKKAFNNRPVVRLNFDQAISLGPDEVPKGPKQQRGMGGFTLCEKCNNLTGHWYGQSFIDWCYQGMEILERSNGNPTLIYITYIYPLRILKQIVTMFFSVNGNHYRKLHPELVKFVLNRDTRFLPSNYRFFVYYNIEGRHRASGEWIAILDTETGQIINQSEITFPPFGYVITTNSEKPDDRLDDRLVEITHFSRYSYDELGALCQKPPVLPTHIAIPGDYRSKDEVYQDAGIDPSS